MDGVPLWLKAAFSKRMDAIGQTMQANSRHRVARKQASALFEQFQSSLSKSQRQTFDEWEDMAGLQEAAEREEIYIRGFLDGFKLYASLNELIEEMAVKDCPSHTESLFDTHKP